MSGKTHPSRRAEVREEDDTQVGATEEEALEEEETEEPDEIDRQELEAAREMDSRNSNPGNSEGEEEEEEPEEIAGLRAAFSRVQDKILWHEEQIEEHKVEILNHEGQIEDLKGMLRNKFDGLVGEITGRPVQQSQPQKRGPGRPKGESRARTNYGDGGSTGDLIAACLKSARKPVNTDAIIDYLNRHGNNTNPSVELSRMVKKGIVNRPQRGYYEWVGE